MPNCLLTVEDGDYSDGGLLAVVLLNLIVLAAIVAVFSWLQRTPKYDFAYAKRSSTESGPGMAGRLVVADIAVEISVLDDDDEKGGEKAKERVSVPPFRPRPRGGWLGWARAAWETSIPEVMARSGLDAAGYLLFLRNMAAAHAVAAVACGVVLVPIHASGRENFWRDQRNDEEILYLRGFADWTAANVSPGSHVMWVHVFSLLAVSAAVVYIADRTRTAFAHLKEMYDRGRVHDVAGASALLTVMLRPVKTGRKGDTGTEPDFEKDTDAATAAAAASAAAASHDRAIASWASAAATATSSGITSASDASKGHGTNTESTDLTVHVIPAEHAPEIIALRAKERAAEEALAGCERKYKSTGQRPTARVGRLAPLCGEAADAIEIREADLAKVRGEITREGASGSGVDTGVRFLVMPTAGAVARLFSTTMTTTTTATTATGPVFAEIDGREYELLRAPRPDEVAWNNLRHDASARRVRRVAMGILVACLCVLWAVPLGLLSSLEQLASLPGVGSAFEPLLDMPPALLGFVSAYLPTIAAIVLNIIVIMLVQVFAREEGHHDGARVEVRSQQIFYAFTLSSVVIFPALIGGLLASLSTLTENLADDPTNAVLDLLTRIVSPTSGFFVAYVVQLALIGTALKLLRAGPLIGGWLKLKIAETDEDRKAALAIAPFPYFIEYGFALLIGSLALLFSLTLPIITLFGPVYFAFKYTSDKLALVDTFPQSYAPHPAFLTSALRRSVFGLVACQVAACILFIAKEAWGQLAISILALVATSVFLALRLGDLEDAKTYGKQQSSPESPQPTRAAAPSDSVHCSPVVALALKAYAHPGLMRAAEREAMLGEVLPGAGGVVRTSGDDDHRGHGQVRKEGQTQQLMQGQTSGIETQQLMQGQTLGIETQQRPALLPSGVGKIAGDDVTNRGPNRYVAAPEPHMHTDGEAPGRPLMGLVDRDDRGGHGMLYLHTPTYTRQSLPPIQGRPNVPSGGANQ